MNRRIVAAALAATALSLPAAALADPGHGHGKPPVTGVAKGKGKAKQGKTVTFIFKGTFTAPGTVTVRGGNAHARKGGYVGEDVAFDLATARIVAADANADQTVDIADVADGDRVVVQARVAKGTRFAAPAEGETAAPIVARKLVDQTRPEAGEDDDAEAAPAA